MAVTKTQAKRIEESRKSLSKKKQEFLLKPVEPSKRQEVMLRNALLGAVGKTKDIVMEVYTKAGSLQAAKDRIDELYSSMSWWDELNTDATLLVNGWNEYHQEAFYNTTTTAAGINVAGFVNEQGIGDLMEALVEVNVDQITDLKEASRKRVIDLVNNSLTGQESKSPTLAASIREAFNGVTAKQARFIARDQTQRAINGMNRFRQERAGIEKYKWITSRDNRVRHTHAHMDGLKVAWKTGTILKTPLSVKRGLAGKNVKKIAGGHVGQDFFNCRCTAAAILEI